MCEIDIDLGEVFKASADYHKDADGIDQLRFDPPVYQQRYSMVLNILRNAKWADGIKKVCLGDFKRNVDSYALLLYRLSNSDVPK